MALHSILVVAVGDKKWKSFFFFFGLCNFDLVRPDQKVCFKFTIWYHCNHSQVPLSIHLLMEVGDFPQVRRGPCLPDEIMTLWLLRMWIADDMETIVKWQTTVTREMGDVGQTWKWGPRAKSYYVVSLYWDPHTYMRTSNQNLNRACFCCPCKICFERRHTLDRLSFYIETNSHIHTMYGTWDNPQKLCWLWRCFEIWSSEIGDDVLAKCYRLADVGDHDWFYNGFLALDRTRL